MSRAALIVLTNCIAVMASAATPSTTTTQQVAEELEEVLVEGRRPTTDARKLISWIERLVGQFRYEGTVERYRSDGGLDRAIAKGTSDCVRFGKAVAVQCLLNVTWSDALTSEGRDSEDWDAPLAPAAVVYGLNFSKRHFGFLQVDSAGIATTGKGWLVEDTLIAKDPCADFPGCVRVVRLEAPPDAKVIRMRVDLERNGVIQVRHNFEWIRQSSALPAATAAMMAPAIPNESPSEPVANVIKVPAAVEDWLRRLPGRFRIPSIHNASCWRLQGDIATKGGADTVPEPMDCRSSGDAKAKGELNNRPADAECKSIGAGPGVRCVIYMPWPESGIPISRKWYQSLNSHFEMYGYDPVSGGIASVMVGPTSSVGPAGFSTGMLKGDKFNYLVDCSRPPCTAVEQMTIGPEGEWVLWQSAQASGMPVSFSWRMDRIMTEALPDDMSTEPITRRRRFSPKRP